MGRILAAFVFIALPIASNGTDRAAIPESTQLNKSVHLRTSSPDQSPSPTKARRQKSERGINPGTSDRQATPRQFIEEPVQASIFS